MPLPWTPRSSRRHYPDEKASMLRYLAEIAEEQRRPVNMTELWKDFQSKTNSPRGSSNLYRLYHKIKHGIERNAEFSMESRILMLITSSTPVTDDFLTRVKTPYEIRVDSKNRIKMFRKHGNLIFQARKELKSTEMVFTQGSSGMGDGNSAQAEDGDVILHELENYIDGSTDVIEEVREAPGPDQSIVEDSFDAFFNREESDGTLDETMVIEEEEELFGEQRNVHLQQETAENRTLTPDISASTPKTTNSTSLKQFLAHQQLIMLHYKVPGLMELSNKCQEAIDKLGSTDKLIPNTKLTEIMETAISSLLND